MLAMMTNNQTWRIAGLIVVQTTQLRHTLHMLNHTELVIISEDNVGAKRLIQVGYIVWTRSVARYAKVSDVPLFQHWKTTTKTTFTSTTTSPFISQLPERQPVWVRLSASRWQTCRVPVGRMLLWSRALWHWITMVRLQWLHKPEGRRNLWLQLSRQVEKIIWLRSSLHKTKPQGILQALYTVQDGLFGPTTSRSDLKFQLYAGVDC